MTDYLNNERVKAARKKYDDLLCSSTDLAFIPSDLLLAFNEVLAVVAAVSGPARTPEGEPHPESFCHDCGGPNVRWFAPNDLWNLVIGGPEAKDDPGGIVCPICFVRRAEKADISPSAWLFTIDQCPTGDPRKW